MNSGPEAVAVTTVPGLWPFLTPQFSLLTSFPLITILDYGLANLRSVQKAFERVGHAAEIVRDPEHAAKAERVVLPGVGAVADALASLRASGMDQVVLDHITRGRPFLGICLGLQMLFDVCYEDGEHRGLGVLPGEVVRFEVDRAGDLKVPHMGWNGLTVRHASPLMRGLEDGPAVYFVHSYHAVCERPEDVATVTDYGGEFVSSVWRDNVVAAQFHPEKSQAVGLRMLDNFAEM